MNVVVEIFFISIKMLYYLEHTLSLVTIEDGLKHRPKAEWSVVYMNSELNDFEIWLKSALQDESEIELPSPRQPVEKSFCLSVAKVSYGRETVVPNQNMSERNKEVPTHRLVVYDLRGAWTKSNRNVAFALFDTFMKTMVTKLCLNDFLFFNGVEFVENEEEFVYGGA